MQRCRLEQFAVCWNFLACIENHNVANNNILARYLRSVAVANHLYWLVVVHLIKNGKLLVCLQLKIEGKSRCEKDGYEYLETKYTTMAKWQDELTFNWHVLLDASKAKEKDPKNLPAQYSYYNTQVRYVDIKKGSHMASVCLPPSVLERFGEPCTISLIITNKEGDELAFHTENMSGDVNQAGEKWWENDKFMNWQKKIKGEMKPMLERRQGLVDRSKTPFWLVNNADYELVQ